MHEVRQVAVDVSLVDRPDRSDSIPPDVAVAAGEGVDPCPHNLNSRCERMPALRQPQGHSDASTSRLRSDGEEVGEQSGESFVRRGKINARRDEIGSHPILTHPQQQSPALDDGA